MGEVGAHLEFRRDTPVHVRAGEVPHSAVAVYYCVSYMDPVAVH